MFDRSQHRRPRRPGGNAGYSMIEMLMVLALLGIVLTVSSAAWMNYQRKANYTTTVTLARSAISQARLLSIYRNVNHFVVVDPENHAVRIFEDNGSTPNSYDSDDSLISQETWPSSVYLDLPTEPDPLADPVVAGNMTDSWEIPDPDTSAAWGTTLKGVMTTPGGLIMSAEATPAVLGLGVMVFNDPGHGTVALAVDGRSGLLRIFRLNDSYTWDQL